MLIAKLELFTKEGRDIRRFLWAPGKIFQERHCVGRILEENAGGRGEECSLS